MTTPTLRDDKLRSDLINALAASQTGFQSTQLENIWPLISSYGIQERIDELSHIGISDDEAFIVDSWESDFQEPGHAKSIDERITELAALKDKENE